MIAMRLTDVERGIRRPAEYLPQGGRLRRHRRGADDAERQARRQLAVRASDKLASRQAVAFYLGLHPTAVTRWVRGHTLVPAKHLPALRAIVEDREWTL